MARGSILLQVNILKLSMLVILLSYLYNYGIRRGDAILKQHYYKKHHGNTFYFSKNTQNEIIVAGHKNGGAAQTRNINHKAIYTHCFPNRLNFAVDKSCSIRSVQNMLETVKNTSYLLNLSEQRQRCFEQNIDLHAPMASRRLKDVCRTRWLGRIKGLEVFEDLFVPLKKTLEVKLDMNKSSNRKTSSQSF